jgi:hypothetical protein
MMTDKQLHILENVAEQLYPSRTPLQERIYRLTAACMDVIMSGDVVFQDAGALEAFQERLPDMVQAINTAMLGVMAVETTADGEAR